MYIVPNSLANNLVNEFLNNSTNGLILKIMDHFSIGKFRYQLTELSYDFNYRFKEVIDKLNEANFLILNALFNDKDFEKLKCFCTDISENEIQEFCQPTLFKIYEFLSIPSTQELNLLKRNTLIHLNSLKLITFCYEDKTGIILLNCLEEITILSPILENIGRYKGGSNYLGNPDDWTILNKIFVILESKPKAFKDIVLKELGRYNYYEKNAGC